MHPYGVEQLVDARLTALMAEAEAARLARVARWRRRHRGLGIARRSAPFELNERVEHASWGPGLVMRQEGDKIVILFDSVGYRTLSIEMVAAKALLHPVK